MRKASSKRIDDLRREYDFSSLRGGVRGKYYRRFQAGTNIVRLEPDLARVFPTDEAVNEALRTVVRASRASRRSTRLPVNFGAAQLIRSVRPTRGGSACGRIKSRKVEKWL
jgi:hypothetical protein